MEKMEDHVDGAGGGQAVVCVEEEPRSRDGFLWGADWGCRDGRLWGVRGPISCPGMRVPLP